MAITTFDGYIASAKQLIPWTKTATRTTVSTGWFSLIDIAGNPGGGTLAGTSTTTGVVPDDAVAGFPPISTFGGGATGYLTNMLCGSSVACRLMLFDMLWKGGAYAFNASTSGNTPTSYSARIPDSNYSGTQIWLEQVTAATGVQNVAVTYINQSGTAGRTTGTVATAANTVGRMFPLPLQAGDSGVQGVTGVVGSVATAGTFNILVLRPLWTGRIGLANITIGHDLSFTGMPQVFDTSALFPIVSADSTSSGVPDLLMTIANG